MKRLIAVLLIFYSSLAFADPPVLEIPGEIRPAGQYARVLPKTDAVAVAFVGLDNLDPIPSDLLADKRMFLLDTRGLAVGRYRFAAVGAGKTGEQSRTDFAVVIGTPPAPPGPNPPDPNPDPNPDPFTRKGDHFSSHGVAPGFRVLVVFDADHLKDYPSAQRVTMNSDDVHAYYRAHCIKGVDGTPDWRCLPIDTVFAADVDPMWPKMMALPRKSLPWVFIGNGKSGYSGPFPKDTDDFLALLAKYGGK